MDFAQEDDSGTFTLRIKSRSGKVFRLSKLLRRNRTVHEQNFLSAVRSLFALSHDLIQTRHFILVAPIMEGLKCSPTVREVFCLYTISLNEKRCIYRGFRELSFLRGLKACDYIV